MVEAANMNSAELKRLRQFYLSLTVQQKIYESSPKPYTSGTSLLPLENELQQLNAEFPSLIQQFNKDDYFAHLTSGAGTFYGLHGIKAFIAAALARLNIEIEAREKKEESVSIPVGEKRKFAFIGESALRKIIERDYDEIQRAYASQCWKSVIILCGGMIEAILMDLLCSNDVAARVAKSAPKQPDITHWDLATLINVAVELKLVSEGVEKLSHPLREYRNLIHPGNELRNRLRFGAEEAKIAIEVLNILHRDLSD
jgi:hypothetical protein